MNKLDRQLALEREMTGLGHRRIMVESIEGKDTVNAKGERIHKKSARELGQESRTVYGRQLVSTAVEHVGAAINEFMNAEGAGRKSVVRGVFRQFYAEKPKFILKSGETILKAKERLEKEIKDWEKDNSQQCRVISTIGLLSVVDSIVLRKTYTNAAMGIGNGLEDELRFRYFKAKNPALWSKVFGDLQDRENNLERRRAVLIHSMSNDETKKASKFKPWSPSEKVAVGAKVLEIIVNSTDLVRVVSVRKPRSKEKQMFVEPTEATVEFISNKLDTIGMRYPVFLPALCSPKRWVHPMNGGYYSSIEELKPVRMVKVYGNERGAAHLKRLCDARDRMPMVYRAVNAVQATPWKINKPVLAVLQQAWAAGGIKIGKMPQRTDVTTLESAFPLPEFREEYKTDEAKMKAFRRKRAKIYQARVEQTSRVIQMERLLGLAEKFADEPTLYFPTQLDFRGRMYAMPSFLNPQGTDVAKGLLTFARGCKLGASGLRWLLIHAANMHGEDKISFDEREQWTLDNMALIHNTATLPFEHREWMKADKPWQFLAACIELNEAYKLDEPTEYFSHLPVTVDGTCNGLQHFSAMLLDPAGAQAVNLTPNEKPSDIYQIVADKVKAKFEQMDEPMAKQWLAWGFDRKATKRSVMILPYSGTLHASKEYVREYVKDRDDKCPFTDEFKATSFFAQHVWQEIENTVPAAREAMKWLKSVAKAVTKSDKTLNWHTPLHFQVEQDNRELDQFRVDLMIGKSVRYAPMLVEESERLDESAQMLGVSPNFVHSLDAACLMLTVCRALDEGIEDFAMVHDSYGVLAGRMDTLYMGLRQAFVDIYQHDVMNDFLTAVTTGLPQEEVAKLRAAMPTKGQLNLESVKDSKYFFA
jgi:DNA-directed RNA polymerase